MRARRPPGRRRDRPGVAAAPRSSAATAPVCGRSKSCVSSNARSASCSPCAHAPRFTSSEVRCVRQSPGKRPRPVVCRQRDPFQQGGQCPNRAWHCKEEARSAQLALLATTTASVHHRCITCTPSDSRLRASRAVRLRHAHVWFARASAAPVGRHLRAGCVGVRHGVAERGRELRAPEATVVPAGGEPETVDDSQRRQLACK